MRILAMVVSACALSATLSAQVPDFTPKTPVIGALLHNDVAEANRLLARGADPNESGFVGMPPIVLAIVRQDLDLLRMMAARGADRWRSSWASTNRQRAVGAFDCRSRPTRN